MSLGIPYVAHGLLHGQPLLSQRVDLQQQQREIPDREECAQGSVSSEGFTSFFTTTHSGGESGSSTSVGNEDGVAPIDHRYHENEVQQQHDHSHVSGNNTVHQQEQALDDQISDTSSLVVLARSKRKHQSFPRNNTDEDGMNGFSCAHSSSSRCNQTAATSTTSLVGNPPLIPHESEPRVFNKKDNINKNPNDPQESSVSSSSSSDQYLYQQQQQQQQQPHNHLHLHQAAPPRQMGISPLFVTDISSSNRTDSTSSNQFNTSTSGSGSAGNTGSSGTGSGTGSGSNQGSSGSGNDGDGKGSSEDVAKEEDNTCVKYSNQASNESHVSGCGIIPHRQEVISALEGKHFGTHHENGLGAEQDKAIRERKLLDKKRKRIEMRREYEAQQHSESAETDETKSDVILRPGKPIAMEEVLQFSRIPRLVVQAVPPFTVVHTNAAYCRLTGLDSHKVVGKPIYTLLLLHDEAEESFRGLPEETNQNENNHYSSLLSAAVTTGFSQTPYQNQKFLELERLIASSGFGRFHSVYAYADPRHLIGSNVDYIKDGVPKAFAAVSIDRPLGDCEVDNQDIGLVSTSEARPVVRCRLSIAPVISLVINVDILSVLEQESLASHQKTKRRKLPTSEQDSHRKNQQPKESTLCGNRKHSAHQTITHFVIQLQRHEQASYKQGCDESFSSASASASVVPRLIGLSKEELLMQQKDVEGSIFQMNESEMLDDDPGDSQSTETKDPITAVG